MSPSRFYMYIGLKSVRSKFILQLVQFDSISKIVVLSIGPEQTETELRLYWENEWIVRILHSEKKDRDCQLIYPKGNPMKLHIPQHSHYVAL